jgi:hypothetical protein
MAEPRIEVLGVYHLPVTEDLFHEQFDILYGFPMSNAQRAEAQSRCREQLESVVLIEVLLRNRDKRFRVGDFAQARTGQSNDNCQVAWAEAYLSFDGESLLVERGSDPLELDPLRVAFFIHFWDAAEPLQSSYGQLSCPAPQAMPERLKRLVPYEPVD